MQLPGSAALLLASVVFSAFMAAPGLAATRIATEPGLSGYIGLGVSAVQVKSNLIAGDTGTEEIDNLDDAPGSNSASSLSPNLSLTYTFDNLNTEVFLGNSVEDFIRFDLTTAIGLRQQVSGVGIFEVVALRSPAPAEVWSDPYATGVDRDETDREANGIRLQWGAILDSGFDLRLTRRLNEIDDENSGAALVATNAISASEQQTLNRDGDLKTVTLIYNWSFGRGEGLELTGNYIEHDLDGAAMSFDGYSLQLTGVSVLAPKIRLTANLLLGSFDYDAQNPVYGKTNNKKLAAASLSFFFRDVFDAKGWTGAVILAYADEDNAIDFYDTTAAFANLGLIYRF